MSTFVDTEQVYTFTGALRILREKIQTVLDSNTNKREGIPCLRVEVKVEPQDILSWLNQQTNPVKVYWKSRKGEFALAGVGAADSLQGNSPVNTDSLLTQINKNLSFAHPFQRYYGGMAFDPSNCARSQAHSFSFRFILPRFELFASSDETFLACNIFSKTAGEQNGQNILAELDRLNTSQVPPSTQIPQPQNRDDCPSKDQWQSRVQDIIDACGKKIYEKVVLARKSTFTFNKPVNPFAVLKRLDQWTSDCFLFSFQFQKGEVFLGASPERLFKRQDKSIETEAIAGTRRRGQTQTEDQQFMQELSESSKDSREHGLVVDMIQKNLSPLCEFLNNAQHPSLLSLKGGHHLISRFQGQLKEGILDRDLLRALHPTPAVAGCPTAQALNEIRSKEPFDRGWYAGPVGYIGKDETEFVVAIRSGLLRETTLDLFSGAGIIAQSSAVEEYNETEYKLGSFLKIFEPWSPIPPEAGRQGKRNP